MCTYRIFRLFFAIFILTCFTGGLQAQPIVADHSACAQLYSIPDSVISSITGDYNIYYAHTSHGSQIMTGLDMVYAEDIKFDEPYFYERSDDLGHVGDTSWVPHLRTYLAATPECNMAMFSWCGGCSDNSEVGINTYLAKMTELEADYPGIIFIYMTGHLDGGGVDGDLYTSNNQIRAYCTANDKVLFDFADIESYDPDGTYYPNETDACYWCEDWCAVHTCPSCDGCAHSHCFNCYQKGKAWWWMMATISGWNVEPDTIPNVVAVSPSQNEQNADLSSDVSVTFDIAMNETSINTGTFRVFSQTTGLLPGTMSYNSMTRTATFNPTSDFTVGDIVTVILTGNIESSAGIPLEGGYSWMFTCDVTAGSGEFADSSVVSLPNLPWSMIVADFNRDGNIDIAVVTDNGSNGLLVSFGNGDNTFQAFTSYATPSWLFGLTAADVNNDGWIDIIGVGEASEYFPLFNVYLNDGDGTFTEGQGFAGNSGTRSICPVDLNHDGYLDLLSSHDYFSTQIFAHLNNGNGIFSLDTTYDGSYGNLTVNSRDYNNDGYPDIAAATDIRNYTTVFLNDGTGKMTAGIPYNVYDHPRDIVSADFDNDGDVDIFTASEDGEYMGFSSIINNNGDGTFAWFQSYYMEYLAVQAIDAADFNNDGYSDVTCILWGTAMEYMPNQGDGTFDSIQAHTMAETPVDIATADTDNDGDIDILVASQSVNTITVFINGTRDIICGDANNDASINIADAVFIISYVFKGGPPSDPECAADGNTDGGVNVGDAVYIIQYVFNGGAPPGETCCD